MYNQGTEKKKDGKQKNINEITKVKNPIFLESKIEGNETKYI